MATAFLKRFTKGIKRIFQNKQNNIMRYLPVATERILTITQIISRMWGVDDPQAFQILVDELEGAINHFYATVEDTVDLSDSKRLATYRNVRDDFVSTLMIQRPEIKQEILKSFIYEHSAFMMTFNKLKSKDLAIQAQRLHSIANLVRE